MELGKGWIAVHVEKCLLKKQKGRLWGHFGESRDDNFYRKIELLINGESPVDKKWSYVSSQIYNYYLHKYSWESNTFYFHKVQLSHVVSKIRTPPPTPPLDLFSRTCLILSPTFLVGGAGESEVASLILSHTHIHTHPTSVSFPTQAPTSPQHICFLVQSPEGSLWVKNYHDWAALPQ